MKSIKSFPVETLFFILTLLLAVSFGLFLSMERVTDPFLYYDVAFIKSIQDSAQVLIPETGPYTSLKPVIGRQILMMQYVSMMGVTPEALQFLPIGSILVMATLYLVAVKLLHSPAIASMVTLYLAFNLSHAAALYSIFAYAFGLPVFLGLVLFAMRIFHRRTIVEVFLMLLLYVGVHFIHYTLATWLITFLIGANILIGVQKALPQVAPFFKPKPVYYLTTSFTVIFLAFNETLYNSYLPLFGLDALDGAIQNFLSYVSIDPSTINRSSYRFIRPASVGLISAITLVLILLPIFVGIVGDLYRLLVNRKSAAAEDSDFPVRTGILTMGFVDSFSYAIRGRISTKSFSMIFPLLSLCYVQRVRQQWLPYGFAALLLVTSIAKFAIFYNHDQVVGNGVTQTDLAAVLPSATWLHHQVESSQYTIQSDLNLYGKYLVASVDQKQTPAFQSYKEDLYEKVLGVSTSEGFKRKDEINVIAIDRNSKEPVIGFVWARFQPFRNYLAQIRGWFKIRFTLLIYRQKSI
ncbi:hypothetical protein KFU94_21465 [Chloroflexi bacterium TSY]|nr:hypothetical protein [Chloroflexi bacterium TSY]